MSGPVEPSRVWVHLTLRFYSETSSQAADMPFLGEPPNPVIRRPSFRSGTMTSPRSGYVWDSGSEAAVLHWDDFLKLSVRTQCMQFVGGECRLRNFNDALGAPCTEHLIRHPRPRVLPRPLPSPPSLPPLPSFSGCVRIRGPRITTTGSFCPPSLPGAKV
jgi:hypothetical protein